ncbi:MAG TPA: 3-oxoacyl-[acyl-carrier-protein] synthase III C-terminal domain-containing protein [Gemmatimonadaceae bacterium]|jgi:3-oxoacyl-[acyl-carrier-protein] synthase III|nr:3-oxoacyl-[acyl-carrier-protein] synthase III C-terminal domain-containing protein [Gemmatimonadaceae bacterium]
MSKRYVGIESIAEYLPPRVATVAELGARGLLNRSAVTLRSFGFETVHLAGDESNLDMAIAAAEKLLHETGIDRDEIGMILYAAALNSSSTLWNGNGVSRPGSVLDLGNVHDLFKYPASVLQTRLDLPNAAVVGVNQVGCASIFAALRMARALIATEDSLKAILCVSADKFPADQPRDLAYNLVSDGACAALVRRGAVRNRIVECTQVTKGALWDSDTIENEIIAAYFPTAAALIERTLKKARLTIDDIALVIPHNVSLRSWEILGRLIKCPADRIYTNNISKVGHTIASDNLLNLRHATDAGLVKKGDYMLLFTFGYGSNWASMVVQH